MSIKFKKLNKTIIKCKKCPRLVNFIKKISTEKRKQNKNENYWGKPVAGFGDTNAKLLILGLAPAAHGGTRTGRAFTGDKSGEFLFKCLHKAKISNQSNSENLKDGLKLNSTYITNILKCVPPGDKPENKELNNCSKYFNEKDNCTANSCCVWLNNKKCVGGDRHGPTYLSNGKKPLNIEYYHYKNDCFGNDEKCK